MSWGEIKKAVNSDLNEPLNYLAWIDDLATYGVQGYTFNTDLNTKELMVESILVYRNKIARQVLYDNATDDLINFYIQNSKKLSEQLNAFNDDNTAFVGNNYSDFLNQDIMTVETLNDRFKSNLYDVKLKDTVGLGAWMNTFFNLSEPALDSLDDITQIVNSSDAVMAIFNDTLAKKIITENANASTILFNSSVAVMTIINNATLLNQVATDEVSLAGIFDSWIAKELIWEDANAANAFMINATSRAWLIANKVQTIQEKSSTSYVTKLNKKIMVLYQTRTGTQISGTSGYRYILPSNTASTMEELGTKTENTLVQNLEMRSGHVNSNYAICNVHYVQMQE